ncbi:hypothetical protein F4781DRAFT_80480 [Annulohypoxylon bovei var. microspora]|nr:hypothetical protein F4781DRAFT_80480 [Annulohypoxylon bovei var. microspora]
MSTTSLPTPSQLSGKAPVVVGMTPGNASRNSQNMTTTCQAIVCYHSCGCKSNKDVVYFCTRPNCRHETSSLVVAGLPFACGSQSGRSEACKMEDIAKKEFVREVDTADKLESFVVLPECTRDDVDALVSPWTGPLTSDGEFFSNYQQRHSVKNDTFPSQETPLSSPIISSKGDDLEDIDSPEEVDDVERVEQKPGDDFEVRDEADRGDENIKVGSEQQDGREEDKDIRKDGHDEIELFVVGDNDDENEFVDICFDDEYDIDYENIDVGENPENHGQHKGKANSFQRDIENTIDSTFDNPEVSSNVVQHPDRTPAGEKAEHKKMSIIPYAVAVDGACDLFSPMPDTLVDEGMSDDLIDFLMAAKEKESRVTEKAKTTMEMIFACFRGF